MSSTKIVVLTLLFVAKNGFIGFEVENVAWQS
jgi:hypothetical protein